VHQPTAKTATEYKHNSAKISMAWQVAGCCNVWGGCALWDTLGCYLGHTATSRGHSSSWGTTKGGSNKTRR